jgi:CubicO group peptidase (beta-lactamase class C family)
MDTSSDVMLDQALALARRLSPQDRATLIARLAYELATPDAEPPPANDAWSRLEAFWRDIEALGPAAPSATEQLFADRQQRQATLEGHGDVDA